MAQLVVRNLEEDVKAQLKARALQHGWSMEEEIRQILSKAASDPEPEAGTTGLGSRIAALFCGVGLKDPLPELRGQDVEPIDLDR